MPPGTARRHRGLLFLTLAALWLAGAEQQYMAFLRMLGVRAFRLPFLDTHAVMSAMECHRLGVDVYMANPCDTLGRMHVYSPFWLHLGVLPITTSVDHGVGLALDVGFPAQTGHSPTGTPDSRHPGHDTRGRGFPFSCLALERANNDC